MDHFEGNQINGSIVDDESSTSIDFYGECQVLIEEEYDIKISPK